ncbi:hypothetical protein Zmor_014185 [Zophobas morio]|uniref:Uncharacterized protein n=1 Tax=Zophobas morio TaxID=2755281 RepID=A0AA38MGC4_9CUCU|nr:hypothetical protein Zmor_014185 [Zophobas morio]
MVFLANFWKAKMKIFETLSTMRKQLSVFDPFLRSAVPSLVVRSGMNAIDEAGPGVTALCRGAVIPGLQFSVRDTVSRERRRRRGSTPVR